MIIFFEWMNAYMYDTAPIFASVQNEKGAYIFSASRQGIIMPGDYQIGLKSHVKIFFLPFVMGPGRRH